ncbi:hypothetical protein BN181_2750006 [Clostridioides difficile T17]|nr:hypothetical protein BN181_2750006 [Clostridioides difficile T17]
MLMYIPTIEGQVKYWKNVVLRLKNTVTIHNKE